MSCTHPQLHVWLLATSMKSRQGLSQRRHSGFQWHSTAKQSEDAEQRRALGEWSKRREKEQAWGEKSVLSSQVVRGRCHCLEGLPHPCVSVGTSECGEHPHRIRHIGFYGESYVTSQWKQDCKSLRNAFFHMPFFKFYTYVLDF